MENKKITPSISTLVAELRVIKIGNKQMTFGVFNQLYQKEPFDDQWNIIFQIWGKVFYRDETWIVFQQGDSLFKFNVEEISIHIPTFPQYVKYLPDDIMKGKWEKLQPYVKIDIYSASPATITCSEYAGNKRYSWKHSFMNGYEEKVANELPNVIPSGIFKELMDDYYRVKQFAEKRLSLYNKLNALDQLFIAV